MKKVMCYMIITVLVGLTSCSSDDPYSVFTNDSFYMPGGETNGSISSGSGDLATFTIAVDSTSTEPTTMTEKYYPDDEDVLDLSDNPFTTTINIVYNGSTVSYNTADGVTISSDGAHLVANHADTKNVCYTVSGSTSEGSLTIVGDKKYELRFSGASITNPDSSAVNLLSKKRAYIVLDSGTSNYMADGNASKADDQKSAFYGKGKMLFYGTGKLRVFGNYNNGIACADYIVLNTGNNIYVRSAANHGIKANDGIIINGGIVNVEVSATAAKGINSESNIIINGGRTTVITTGGGTYEDGDTKASAAIKADSVLTINGGEVLVKSTGKGGKGLKADWEAYINGGTIQVLTTGSVYSSGGDTSSPKGIMVGTKNVHGQLNITDGNLMVRTEGSNGEGIESKGTLTVSGGTILVSAYDDGINSASDMTVSGGVIKAIGSHSDGVDSNGNLYVTGGNIVAYGASGAETGIDVGERYKLYVTGGALFGIGGRIDATYAADSNMQAYASTTGSATAGSTVTVSSGSTLLATFTLPGYTYNNGTIFVSAPDMVSGNSYTLTLGSTSQTVTATTSSSNGMGGGGMPGGNGPGMR